MFTNTNEGQTDLSRAVARWENEGGAPARVDNHKDMNWFVPPLAIPALIVTLMFARFVQIAYGS